MVPIILSIIALVVSMASVAWTEFRLAREKRHRQEAGPVAELWAAITRAQIAFDALAAAGGKYTDWFIDPERQYLGEDFERLGSRVGSKELAAALHDVKVQWDAAFANAPAPTGPRVYLGGPPDSAYAQEDAFNAKKLGAQGPIIENGQRAVKLCSDLTASLEQKTR